MIFAFETPTFETPAAPVLRPAPEPYHLHAGDCLVALKSYPDNYFDAVITDPPYGLHMMGKKWDVEVPGVHFWVEFSRVLKPGGYLLAFGGTRTYHTLVTMIESAGFEIRDMFAWIYANGFPKSVNVAKAVDAELTTGKSNPIGMRQHVLGEEYHLSEAVGTMGVERSMLHARTTPPPFEPQTEEAKKWLGFGTALKPAIEPICLARKPLSETSIPRNVLEWGTGALNIGACMVPVEGKRPRIVDKPGGPTVNTYGDGLSGSKQVGQTDAPRYPANVMHDGSPEVLAALGKSAPIFYCPKTSKRDRNEGCDHLDAERVRQSGHTDQRVWDIPGSHSKPRANHHPTVKPTPLLREFVRLVGGQPGGVILDPFAGSGSTGKAALLEGFRFVGCEKEPAFAEIAEARLAHAREAFLNTRP